MKLPPPYRLTVTSKPRQSAINTLRQRVFAEDKLNDLPQADYAVVLRNLMGQIIGGALCEFDAGWLFIDALWVEDSERGKGYGKQILQAAESYAAQQGVHNVYLFTSDFQAKPVYEACGYHLFGTMPERPIGHEVYYFQKNNLSQQAIHAELGLEIEHPPRAASLARIDYEVLAHALAYVPIENRKLAVLLHENQDLRGGVFGGTFWDCFDLRLLWLDERLKGLGYDKLLLQIASAECQQRGVISIVCDTANPLMHAFYLSIGFETFGVLDQRPPASTSYFMRKWL